MACSGKSVRRIENAVAPGPERILGGKAARLGRFRPAFADSARSDFVRPAPDEGLFFSRQKHGREEKASP